MRWNGIKWPSNWLFYQLCVQSTYLQMWLLFFLFQLIFSRNEDWLWKTKNKIKTKNKNKKEGNNIRTALKVIIGESRISEIMCSTCISLNTLRPRQMAPYFADDIFQLIFLCENYCILSSLKFVPEIQINNKSALGSVMVCSRTSDMLLPEPTMTQFSDVYICIYDKNTCSFWLCVVLLWLYN